MKLGRKVKKTKRVIGLAYEFESFASLESVETFESPPLNFLSKNRNFNNDIFMKTYFHVVRFSNSGTLGKRKEFRFPCTDDIKSLSVIFYILLMKAKKRPNNHHSSIGSTRSQWKNSTVHRARYFFPRWRMNCLFYHFFYCFTCEPARYRFHSKFAPIIRSSGCASYRLVNIFFSLYHSSSNVMRVPGRSKRPTTFFILSFIILSLTLQFFRV